MPDNYADQTVEQLQGLLADKNTRCTSSQSVFCLRGFRQAVAVAEAVPISARSLACLL